MKPLTATGIFLLINVAFLKDSVSAQQYTVVQSTPSGVPVSGGAAVQYQCNFQNQWSRARHPIQYPFDSHWSPPVLASHSSGYQMWAPGGIATLGIENVAEDGTTANLVRELGFAGGNVADFTVGIVTFNAQVQQQSLGIVGADPSRPFLSGVSMIAPSPDWFSGFYDFRAHNGETWYRNIVIDTFPFDAGTESGINYNTNNPPSPRQPIRRFTTATVPPNGIFLSPQRNSVLSVARWSCTLLNPDVAAPLVSNGGGTGVAPGAGVAAPQPLISVLGDGDFCPNEPIQISFTSPTRQVGDWIGIFPASANPNSLPGPLLWLFGCGTQTRCLGAALPTSSQVTFRQGVGSSGATFPLPAGQYRAHLIRLTGAPYRAIASAAVFTVRAQCPPGPPPPGSILPNPLPQPAAAAVRLSPVRACFPAGATLGITFSTPTPRAFDFIGVYPDGTTVFRNPLLWVWNCGTQFCPSRPLRSGRVVFRNLARLANGRFYRAVLLRRGSAPFQAVAIGPRFRIGGCV